MGIMVEKVGVWGAARVCVCVCVCICHEKREVICTWEWCE